MFILGEHRRQLVVLATLVHKEDVVHNVADEIVGVVADRLVGVIVAAGRWGRRLASVVVITVVDIPIVDVPIMDAAVVPVVVAVVVPVVAAAVVPVVAASIVSAVVVAVIVVGGLRGPTLVPVAVAKIPGVPLRSPFPEPERVPGRGRDGERRVTPQVRREQGTPPHDLRNPLRTFTGNRRNRHAPAVEKPPRREVGIRPWHGPAARIQVPSHPDRHVHPIARGTSMVARGCAIVVFGRQPVARARRLVVVLALAERPPTSCHGLAC
jgi:hypothetical protein